MKSKLFICCIFLLTIPVSAQSGGQFAVTQSVIANGGAESNGGNFGVTATTAQTNVGANLVGGNFGLQGGFWQAALAPSAAQVSVSGRVIAADGQGIRNARVLMTNQAGETQSAITASFGYFCFPEVLVGETYIISVHTKRFNFSNGTQILSVMEDVNDIIFIAD